MLQYFVKVALTAVIVVAIAEVAKRSTVWAAALASLPLTSILAFVWPHIDGEPTNRIAALADSIVWLVVPSLLLFLVLPMLLRAGWNFWPGLLVSCMATAAGYGASMWFLQRVGANV